MPVLGRIGALQFGLRVPETLHHVPRPGDAVVDVDPQIAVGIEELAAVDAVLPGDYSAETKIVELGRGRLAAEANSVAEIVRPIPDEALRAELGMSVQQSLEGGRTQEVVACEELDVGKVSVLGEARDCFLKKRALASPWTFISDDRLDANAVGCDVSIPPSLSCRADVGRKEAGQEFLLNDGVCYDPITMTVVESN
ncbi:MAG TPA: hypothetical protein VF718_11055 [Allosphingosinicella sp.]